MINKQLEKIKSLDLNELVEIARVISISLLSDEDKAKLYKAIDGRKEDINIAINSLAVNGDTDDITGVKNV